MDENAQLVPDDPDAGRNDWYWTKQHSTQELERIFGNHDVDNAVREHAYWSYWMQCFQSVGFASRADLTRFLEHPEWPHAINEVMLLLSREGKLLPEDAAWLLAVLIPSSFAHDQVRAFAVQSDENLEWPTKLRQALSLRANWLAFRILRSLPLEENPKARELVEDSRRPKSVRNQCHRILDEREAESRRLQRAASNAHSHRKGGRWKSSEE